MVGSFPASNAAPYIGAPSRVVSTVDITFDTNLPKSGTPYNPDNQSSGEITLSVLKVDGVNVGYLTVQNSKGTFQGPITFTWEVGSVHTYSWEPYVLFSANKRYVFDAASGVSSGQSGTITVSSGGTVTASYKDESLLSVIIRDSLGSECSSCGSVSPQAGWYATGSAVQIQGTPYTGYTFQKSASESTYVGVQGAQPVAETSTQNPKTITMDTAKTVTVYFQQSQPTTTQIPTTPSPIAPTATETPKSTTTPTAKYLLYQNKQYGFSIKYPSTWLKTDLLKKDSTFSNMINLVRFENPSKDAAFELELIQNDKGTSRKILDETNNQIKSEFKPAFCSQAPAGATCLVDVFEDSYATKNGYKGNILGVVAQMSSKQTTAQIVPIGIAVIPDGNNSWILLGSNLSVEENEQNLLVFSDMSDSFLIFNYKGEQASSESLAPPSAKSGAGELQINSGQFSVSKYSPAEVIVSGKITDYQKGVLLTLKIEKPDKGTTQQNAVVTKDGNFRFPLKLDSNWPSGGYTVSAKYGSQDIGSVSFQVNEGSTKPTTTPTKTPTTTPTKTPPPPLKQKQFQLDVKASQKNDLVSLVIKNSKDSPDNVYSIKLTTANGKITNFVKINNWEHKRLGPDSVMYQTTSSPLHPSDTIQAKLKVDSKNTEIKWEVFTKDQKSLGTGKVKT